MCLFLRNPLVVKTSTWKVKPDIFSVHPCPLSATCAAGTLWCYAKSETPATHSWAALGATVLNIPAALWWQFPAWAGHFPAGFASTTS